MKYFLLILKGFFIGMAKIIPGVSGSVLAISFGIYEKLLEIISNPLKIKKSDIKFLIFLLIGVCLGIALFCNSVKWLLSNFYFPTILLFTGFIIGGLPEITNEIKGKYKFYNIMLFIFSFLSILVFMNLKTANNISNNYYFLMGSIESLTTIIPGISGTAIFMALGWYESLLSTLHNILTFNCSFSISFKFISGFIFTTIFISKILNLIFKKYKTQANFSILGFVVGSILVLLSDLFKTNFNFIEIIIGTILLFIGILATKKINNFFSKI